MADGDRSPVAPEPRIGGRSSSGRRPPVDRRTRADRRLPLTFGSDDRAVSETLGFVLVFSMVVASVSLVFVLGVASLEETRDAERVGNVERAFDVLADNLDDLGRGGAPSRATELDLAGSRLSMPTSSVVLTVNVTNAGTPEPSYSTDVTPIVYSSATTDTRIVYSNGAVVRTDDPGQVMVRPPGGVFLADGARTEAVIPLVQTRADGDFAAVSGGTFLVRADLAIREQFTDYPPVAADNPAVVSGATPDPDGDGREEYLVEYTIETTPSRAIVWERHYDGEIDWTADPCVRPSPGVVRCSFAVERLYVTATRVDVTFE